MSVVGGWKTASFLVGSESNVRQWGPLPAGRVRPSGPCCFAVARAPFVSVVGGWKRASFLVGSPFVSVVGGWKTATAGSVRLSGRCCFAVARAPFVSLVGGWKTASFRVGSESNVRQWGPLPGGPVRPSGPAVSLRFLMRSKSPRVFERRKLLAMSRCSQLDNQLDKMKSGSKHIT